MEGNIVNKFFGKIKDKFNTNSIKDIYPQASEYVFSEDELDSLSKQNNEKIKELKLNVLNNNQGIVEKKEEKQEDIIFDDFVNEDKEIVDEDKVVSDNNVDDLSDSYINLSSDRKDIIMKSFAGIDIVKLDKEIDKGKDIILHNYTITYGDEALSYIYKIRDEYDVVIEYLIGFNNEKKGIYNKTIFSDKLDNEWRYLNNYIKVLEKMRMILKK